MNLNKSCKIFVIGNEKGGAGKTTCSMHLIGGLLEEGFKVVSIDTDGRQHSLTTYINNRKLYNQKNFGGSLPISDHYHLNIPANSASYNQDTEEEQAFLQIITYARSYADYIVIDTPGNYTFLSRLAHSYADTIITPINDSFLDIAVIAEIDPSNFNIIRPSIYSQMIWEQKMKRAERDRNSIEWIIVRNRLSNLDARNKRNIDNVLQALCKRISFKIAPGFSERVVFKELFLQGLTLYDLNKNTNIIKLNASHVAARCELRNFFNSLNNKVVS